jgi:branched-chain amino acid transport system ATP-binding protein
MTALLQIDRLNKKFGGLKVTNDVSLSLAAGDRVALIGPNGAGKTTLVNLVTGQLRPGSGRVLLGGEDVTRISDVSRAQKGLVRTFQVTRLFTEMTPEAHITLSILQRQGRATVVLDRFGHDDEVAAEAADILATLGLTDVARRKVAEIAYGQQRLLEIAIALALRPRVLLLDEPAAGVPSSETPRIEAALARLSSHLAVLMIDHDMDLVFRFARRVIVMNNGAIIFEGAVAAAAVDPAVREAYLGSYAHAGRVA